MVSVIFEIYVNENDLNPKCKTTDVGLCKIIKNTCLFFPFVNSKNTCILQL